MFILQEELANDNNDTGIDVNDVSTADETDDQSRVETSNTDN